MEQKEMQKQMFVGLGHVVKGMGIVAEALMKSGMLEAGLDPQPMHQDAPSTAKTTTERARKAADKAPPKTAPAAPAEQPEGEETAAPTETKAAPVAEKKAAAKKAKPEEPEFDSLEREAKIEHLRGRMVLVAQKNKGDRDKTYAYLEKYKAKKVNELSDDNLANLKNDIEVFLGGPDALDV